MSTSVTANVGVETPFLCGGQVYLIPPIKFGKIKRVWPILMALNKFETDLLARPEGLPNPVSEEFADIHSQRIDFILAIFQVACKEKYPVLTVEFMNDNMTFPEMLAASKALNEFLQASGFDPGEGMPSDQVTEAPAALSTETSLH